MKTQTTAGGDDGGIRTEAPQWGELPDDLLATVRGMATSPFDRARISAVCRSWRAAASRRPAARPSPPLLVLSVPSLPRCGSCHSTENRLYSPVDALDYTSLFLDAPLLQSKALRREIVGSHDGGWLAALFSTRPHAAGYQKGMLVIFNLFTRAEVPLSAKQRDIGKFRVDEDNPLFISKIVFSEDPTSSGCILAAKIHRCRVAVCRIGCPDGGWTAHNICTWGACLFDQLQDIVFFKGDLYGLTRQRLVKLSIGDKNRDRALPVVTTVHSLGPEIPKQIHGDNSNNTDFFLVEVRGKLAIAVSDNSWHRWSSRLFEVAGAEDGYECTEVTSLGNCTLFLCSGCSKAVENSKGDFNHCLEMFHGICGVYRHWEDEDEITRNCVVFSGVCYPHCDGTWLLPPEL